MIEAIKLRNFQAYINTTIRFTEGLNVIGGSSDVGKTTIFRAIEWVLTNRPLGLGYLRDGADGPIHVTVWFSDGKVIDRIRGPDTNYYSLTEEGGENDHPQILEADTVGTTVPDFITNAFNLDKHNIKYQHQPMYLIQESAPAAARAINKLVGFDSVGEAVAECDAEIKDNKAEVSKAEAEVLEAERCLKRMEGLETVGEGIEYVEGLDERRCEMARDCLNLSRTVDRLSALRDRAEKDVGFYENYIEPLLSSCSDRVGEIDGINKQAESLSRLLRRAEWAEKGLGFYEKNIQSLLASCSDMVDEIDGINKQIEGLPAKIEKAKGKRKEEGEAAAEYGKLRKKVESSIEGLEACPFCNGEPINRAKSRLRETILGGGGEG